MSLNKRVSEKAQGRDSFLFLFLYNDYTKILSSVLACSLIFK